MNVVKLCTWLTSWKNVSKNCSKRNTGKFKKDYVHKSKLTPGSRSRTLMHIIVRNSKKEKKEKRVVTLKREWI